MSNLRIATEPLAAAAPPSETVHQKNRAPSAKSAKTAPTPKKDARKSGRSLRKAAIKPAAERGPKKAEVIALMRRSKGATLAEIRSLTGWQKHTVRGFVSILAKKGEKKIESFQNALGERTYRVAK